MYIREYPKPQGLDPSRANVSKKQKTLKINKIFVIYEEIIENHTQISYFAS